MKTKKIKGYITNIYGNTVKGWVYELKNKKKVELSIWLDDCEFTQIETDSYVPYLEKLGIEIGKYSFELKLPDSYLDAKEHKIAIKHQRSNQLIVEKTFSMKLKGNLDYLGPYYIMGWIVDTQDTNQSLTLDLHINQTKIKSFKANSIREDLASVFGNKNLGIHQGIDFNYGLDGYSMMITLKDSLIPLLNTPVMIVSKIAMLYNLQKISQEISSNENWNENGKAWLIKTLIPELKKIIREDSPVIKQPVVKRLPPSYNPIDTTVNVIVPIYKNVEVTRQCLEKLKQVKTQTKYELIVINDQSPQTEMYELLEEFSQLEGVNLITHEVNQGFVKSVNEGMMFNTQRDVVLLNSDAYVCDGWIDLLQKAVYKADDIASATALSNNATIFSYPIVSQETENVPDDITLEELSAIFAKTNGSEIVDVPTAHGFCVYIRRKALMEVGYFDGETWGKGYGEEVDWSQRAIDLNWRHVAAVGVFAQHVGSQSFTSDKIALLATSSKLVTKKYPEYDLIVQQYVKSDPLAPFRRRIDLERLKRYSHKYVLMISHGLGGGTQRHIDDLIKKLQEDNIPSLLIQPDKNSPDWLNLTCSNLELLARYKYTELSEFSYDLKELGIINVHVHHAMGFPYNFIPYLLRELNLDYDVTLHDYMLICPRITLSLKEGEYCQEPPISMCEFCIKENGTHPQLETLYEEIKTVKKWRLLSDEFLKQSRQIFVPSHDTAERLVKYFPDLKFNIRPHPEAFKKVTLTSQNTDAIIRIGILGGISPQKGLKVLYKAAEYAHQKEMPMEFVVIGYTANDSLFQNLPNVKISGAYEQEELSHVIKKNQLDFAAFLGLWPETYCYTLSEALENGLYPFSLNIGAIGERLSKLGYGCLVPHDIDIDSLVEKLYDYGHQCRQEKVVIEIGNLYDQPFYNSYYSL